MITKVILGNGVALEGVEEVQETIQNEGSYTRKALTINMVNEAEGILLEDIEKVFDTKDALANISIFKKDLMGRTLDEETGEWVEVFGEEYLSDTYSEYSGVASVYKFVDSGRMSIQLSSDPSSLADDKYNELVEANKYLRGVIDVLLGDDIDE